MEMEKRLNQGILEQSRWDLVILLDALREEDVSWVLGLPSLLMGDVTNWENTMVLHKGKNIILIYLY